MPRVSPALAFWGEIIDSKRHLEKKRSMEIPMGFNSYSLKQAENR